MSLFEVACLCLPFAAGDFGGAAAFKNVIAVKAAKPSSPLSVRTCIKLSYRSRICTCCPHLRVARISMVATELYRSVEPSCFVQATWPSFCALQTIGVRSDKKIGSIFAFSFISHLRFEATDTLYPTAHNGGRQWTASKRCI